MQSKFRIGTDQLFKAILLLFAVTAFLNSSLCYFKWESYGLPFLSTFLGALSYMSAILLAFLLIVHARGKHSIKTKKMLPIFMALVVVAYIHLMGYRYVSSFRVTDLYLIVCVICLILLSEKNKQTLFLYMAKFFALIVLPSLAYYLLEMVGIAIPHTILQSEHAGKAARGMYYSHYPFGLILRNPLGVDRFCGVFDEAGYIGTMIALLLAAGFGKLEKRWIVILAIEGILSLSLAFYLIVLIFFMTRMFLKGGRKLVVFLLVLIMGFTIFINVDFENEMLSGIQSRIDITSFYLFEDNRTTNTFDEEYADFWREGGYPLLVGYGYGAYDENPRMTGSLSYKCLFYDYGIVGTLLYLGFFVTLAMVFGVNRKTIPFLLAFFASVFQRPYILTVYYISIFLASLAFIQSNPDFQKPLAMKRKWLKARSIGKGQLISQCAKGKV